MSLAPFDGPRLKIKRAEKHIAELKELVNEFAATVEYIMQPIAQTHTHTTYVFRFAKPPPCEVPVVIGDAVHNLRAALDIMICDIARLREKSSDQLKFPFAPHAEGLEDIFKKGLKRLGPDIVEAVRALKPYKGGNLALRALHDLDIDDKHEAIIPCYLVARAGMHPALTEALQNATGIDFSEAASPMREGRTTSMVINGGNPWEVAQPKLDVPPAPMFDEISPFGGEPVIEVLDRLTKMVREIVESFATKFGVAPEAA